MNRLTMFPLNYVLILYLVLFFKLTCSQIKYRIMMIIKNNIKQKFQSLYKKLI